MICKLVEIRDCGTFIPAMAIRLGSDDGIEQERWLLARAGYGKDFERQSSYIILVKLAGGCDAAYDDPFKWPHSRTMRHAHDWLLKHFDEIESGGLIDVQVIIGETDVPKESERLCNGD